MTMGRIADDEDLGMARQGQVRIDLHPSGPVVLGAQPFAAGEAATPAAPDHGSDSIPSRPSMTTPGVAFRHRARRARTSTPSSSSARSLGGQHRGKGGEQARAGLDQHDPGLARIDVAEVARQRRLRQLRDGAGELHPRRAAAHHDEGQLALAHHRRPRRSRPSRRRSGCAGASPSRRRYASARARGSHSSWPK